MSDLQKIEATVFVYRHRHTGNISAHYRDTALNLKESQEWEHVATLNPRAWIEFNYSLVEQRDEILDSLKKSHNRLLQNDRGYAESNLYLINTKNISKVESEK